MDSIKLKQVTDAIEKDGYTIPTSVNNALEDVFSENTVEENSEINVIRLFYSTEIEDFKEATRIINKVVLRLDGSNCGVSTPTRYEYYGSIEPSMYETAYIEDASGNKLYSIIEYDSGLPTAVEYPDEHTLFLTEPITWDTRISNTIKSVRSLFIYCPETGPEKEDTEEELEEGLDNE